MKTKDDLKREFEEIEAQKNALYWERKTMTDPEQMKEADARLKDLFYQLAIKNEEIRYFGWEQK